ncbi:hypothetical protein [Gluconobacter sp. P5B12]|uniref:hypothetical protein n=1 Tax=Gluconobacter sp. P5B12 TaxID=2762618 RepID=UPI001C03CFA4|nr:hypothetical protein [Gluconobacter sp. P5B12]
MSNNDATTAYSENKYWFSRRKNGCGIAQAQTKKGRYFLAISILTLTASPFLFALIGNKFLIFLYIPMIIFFLCFFIVTIINKTAL